MELEAEHHAIISGIVLLLSAASIGFLKFYSWVLIFLFLIFWALLVFLDFDMDYLWLSIPAVLIGYLLPLMATLFGAIEFHPVPPLEVPLWLPILTANTVICCIKLANWISDKF